MGRAMDAFRNAIGAGTPWAMVGTHAIATMVVLVLAAAGLTLFVFLIPVFMIGFIIGVLRLIPTIERLWPLT